MKYEDKKTLALPLLMIAVLGFFSYRSLRNINMPERDQPLIQIPDIELPSIGEMMDFDIDNMMFKNNLIPTEFIYVSHTLNNKITFQYPSHWTKPPVEIMADHRDIMDHLFIAHSLGGSPTTIVGLKLLSQPDTESVIKTIENIFRQEEATMNILNKTPSNNGAHFEAEYLYEDGERSVSKEKIILIDGDAYIVSILATEPWTDEKANQMNYIIDSIQIID